MTAPDEIRHTVKHQTEVLCKWIYHTDAATRGEELPEKEDAIIQQCISVAECQFVSRMVRDAPVKTTRGPDADPQTTLYAEQAIAYRERHGGTREAAVAHVLPDGTKSEHFGAVLIRFDNIMRARRRAKKPRKQRQKRA